ncbi:MAG TPA: RsmG family class I SAM-dependent methyltransferase, partial [Rhizomicrobium sp.]
MSDAPPEFGPEQFAEAASVSRETLGHLKLYIGVLREWNAQHNLVSAGSLADVWRRHVWDCAQIARYVPADAKTLADLGAGAGFPGLVLA